MECVSMMNIKCKTVEDDKPAILVAIKERSEKYEYGSGIYTISTYYYIQNGKINSTEDENALHEFEWGCEQLLQQSQQLGSIATQLQTLTDKINDIQESKSL